MHWITAYHNLRQVLRSQGRITEGSNRMGGHIQSLISWTLALMETWWVKGRSRFLGDKCSRRACAALSFSSVTFRTGSSLSLWNAFNIYCALLKDFLDPFCVTSAPHQNVTRPSAPFPSALLIWWINSLNLKVTSLEPSSCEMFTRRIR